MTDINLRTKIEDQRMTELDTRLDHPCPKCGYPESPKTDEAFFFRYKTMSEKSKRSFRKVVLALMETEND